MTKEKMLELWRKEFEEGYNRMNFPPQVYEYLDEKIDYPSEVDKIGRKSYASYEDWMLKELDGENAEMARRMLMIVSKVKYGGMVGGTYSIVRDTEICLRIGYDFDAILKQGILRYGTNLDAVSIYKVAELLLNAYPAESEAFANLLLTDKLDAWKKQNADFALAMYLAVHLLKKDAAKYHLYLPALVTAVSKGGDYVLGMLYYGYSLSPELKESLLSKITTNTSAIRTLYVSFMNYSDMQPLLQEIGAPLWPYYYIVANEVNTKLDRSATLHELYKENKEVFLDTYARMMSSTASQDAIYGLYMLAILLKNGEGEALLERADRTIIHAMIRLLNEYNRQNRQGNGGNGPTELQMMNKSNTTEEWKKWLGMMSYFGWGNAKLIIAALGVLYEYSSLARGFVDKLMLEVKGSDCQNNVSLAIGYILAARKKWLGKSPRESLQMLLDADNEFTIFQAFKAYSFNPSAMADALSKEDVEQHKQEALELLTNGSLSIEETIEWLQFIYVTCGFEDYLPLIALLSNKSKTLRKQAETIIGDKEAEVRPLLESQLGKLKGDALAIAKRLIKRWDNERKFGDGFVFTNAAVIEYCTDNYDKGNQKFISWIPEDMFLDIRFADLAEKAPAIVLQYMLSEYLSLEEPYKIKACDKIAEMLHPQDLQAALENIYQYWKDNGAEAKKKMIMIPYCIYASDTQILRLKTQLKDWAEAARGAIAAFVVNAIAMNGGNLALMMIDSMAVKFPNNQVKNASKAAFAFAAKALEIPEDELSDKIVPTLGFSKEGEKILDYGPRNFTITLMPDFSLSIFDNDKQKAIKSMPAPGANDDAVKATAAKKEFSELKKQIKATVQSQTARLEKVLMNGRSWNVKAWSDLFVENPIMHYFAMGLIWGVYENKQLTATFRYMEDGTFNTVDEEEYTLPENATITLVHPAELSEETLAQWKEQLDDYEVVQPLPQLTAPVVTLEEKDLSGKKIVRYAGTVVQSGKIAGIAKKYNMVRGEVMDGGSYICFHWVDKYLNVAVQLNFEYMYMGQEYNDNVTLGDVVLYRLDEDQLTDDEPKNNMLVAADTLPARFISSVIGVFDLLKSE
jgi:hypothetical protein